MMLMFNNNLKGNSMHPLNATGAGGGQQRPPEQKTAVPKPKKK
jgi:hypothetical protein